MIGALLGNRYELIELIGTGGMANVYKAKCTLLNRNVAVKILKDEFKDDEEFVKRFNIESQAAAGLSHNNIVSVYDVGTQGDIHYIVMEYVEGETLKQYLAQNGALPWQKAVDFTIQIASALQHAHRKGIVHRDIKPQNIMVTKDGVLKVMDFGIARAVSSFTMKVDDSTMGTAHYCSPEQARGGYTDEKSDIYSLGVVMYEMLTGRPPFESDNSVSVALKHIQEEAVPPSQIVPGIPENVEAIVKKAMMKDQNERFQSAGEMLIELNWVKQTENGASITKPVYIKDDKAFETKVIKTAEEPDMRPSTGRKRKGKKQPPKKEDKVAVIAAVISSIVVVAILAVLALTFLFPGVLPWGSQPEEIEVPDLIGVNLEDAKKTYRNITFEEEEEYSAEYEEGIIIHQDPDTGVKIKSPFKVKVVVSKGAQMVSVPNVLNLGYREAGIQLDNRDILWTVKYEKSDTIPENIVMDVDPAENTQVKAGVDLVTITVSSGSENKLLEVPNVIGETEESAKRKITSAGLTFSVVEADSTQPKGTVIRQSLAGGTEVAEKTTITITVSTGVAPSSSPTPSASPSTVPSTRPTASSQPSSRPQVTKEITVPLPQDRERVTVRVTANGTTVYERTHNTSEGSVSVPVSGSGTVVVASYIDNVKYSERTLQF